MPLRNPFKWVGFKKDAPKAKAGRLAMPGTRNGIWGFGGQLVNLVVGTFNFQDEAGDPLRNSAVASCVNFIIRNWPQAIPAYYVPSKIKDGGASEMSWEPADHPVTALMRQPSPYYDQRRFMQALLRDYFSLKGKGNAYAYIVLEFGDTGDPIELQYLPAQWVKPVGGDYELISHYEYRPNGRKMPDIPFSRMIHLRNGMDSDDPKIGVDPCYAIYPEIATDNRATRYQFGILKKGGVPPWVIGPDGKDSEGNVATIDEDDAAFIKQGMEENAAGDIPGGGVVIPGGFRLEKLAFSPRDMVMGETQTKAEERIAGVLGVPPVVAGLGAGLEHGTFSNYEQAQESGWQDCIIPLQDDLAGEITSKLLPLYDNTEGAYFGYDRSGIRCLREDESARATDARGLFKDGVISRGSAKRRIGETPEDGDDAIYAKSSSALDLPDPAKVPPATDPKAGKKGRFFDPENLPEFKDIATVAPGGGVLETVAAAFRNALIRHEGSAVQIMQDALEVAEEKIRDDLEALLERMEQAAEDGEEIGASWLDREARYRELISQIESAYQSFGEEAGPKLGTVQREYVDSAASGTRDLAMAAAGPAPVGVSMTWNALPVSTLEALVGFATDGTPLADLLASLGPETATGVREALIAGVAGGYSPIKTAGLMRQGVDAKLALSRARAETIARTETLRAAREAAKRSYQDNRDVVLGWVWTATLDGRTCRGCWAMHGTFHDVSQTLDDHPNGRCVAVPRTRSWSEITGDASLPDTRPVIVPGEERFAALTADRQRQILGDSLHDAFVAGEVTLADCVTQTTDARWGSMRRQATVQEARANAARRQG